MLSFLDLPPEIRLAIYKILLQSSLDKTTRILYSGTNALRCGDSPHCVRHKQPFKYVAKGCVSFLDARIIYARDIDRAKYNIHLADIDDLLFLASTCRVSRSELLALAWSNANIRIESPEIYDELHCIFYDRLTSESCSSIRTLQHSINRSQWWASESKKVVGLIRRRLPRLEQLIVNIPVEFGLRRNPLAPAVAALRSIPLQNTIELRSDLNGRISELLLNVLSPSHPFVVRREDFLNARLQSLRVQVNLIGQRRREELARKETGD
ncbi:hypothetical protein QM012_007487 [Aureobasidium pullulans]|uniref:F-box domain-containing protein n=1 Tax=Aureobasidium pullulans TaxID=5580 RepID=A0ABR0TPI0_AURPU